MHNVNDILLTLLGQHRYTLIGTNALFCESDCTIPPLRLDMMEDGRHVPQPLRLRGGLIDRSATIGH